jgi:hypothetical protein
VHERFSCIYRSGVWKHKVGQQSASGFASELASTGAVRAELPRLLAELDCRRLLDVGCGDWMRHIRLECDYLGILTKAGTPAEVATTAADALLREDRLWTPKRAWPSRAL